MCGRVILLSFEELQDVVEQIKGSRAPRAVMAPQNEQLTFDDALRLRAQARCGEPTQVLAAPFGETPARDYLQMRELRWGFTAPWNGKLVFNTRLESIMQPQSFWKDIARDGRCVLPVVAFFETHRNETVKSPQTGKRIKNAYAFASPDGRPLLLASVHDDERFSVVTTRPNSIVSPVHDRMPLVLREDEVDTWLEGDYATLADRSGFALASAPEHAPARHHEQQTLF